MANSELLSWDKCCNASSRVASSPERVSNRGIGVIKKKTGKKKYTMKVTVESTPARSSITLAAITSEKGGYCAYGVESCEIRIRA